MIYVVIPASKESGELSEANKKRLRGALKAVSEGDMIALVGGKAYESKSPSVDKEMKKWLIHMGWPETSIHSLPIGEGMFAEAKMVCRILNIEDEIMVVSSFLYYAKTEAIWRKYAREQHMEVEFLSVADPGDGHMVHFAALVYGSIISVALFMKCQWMLEKPILLFK